MPFAHLALVPLLLLTPGPPTAHAGAPHLAEPAQRARDRGIERDVRALVTRLEKQADRFRKSVDRSLDRSRLDGTRREDEINRLVRDLENATDRLEDRVKDDRAASEAAREVLRRGTMIDTVMRRHDFGARAERDWRTLRTDLERLARLYRLAFVWDRRDGRSDRQ